MYRYSPFMITSSADGALRPILRRSVHDWRLRRGIFFSYMSGRIIYGLVIHLHLRRFTIPQDWYIFRLFSFLDTWDFWTAVCILAMQRPDVIACNESAHFRKKIMFKVISFIQVNFKIYKQVCYNNSALPWRLLEHLFLFIFLLHFFWNGYPLPLNFLLHNQMLLTYFLARWSFCRFLFYTIPNIYFLHMLFKFIYICKFLDFAPQWVHQILSSMNREIYI
jgi:hypothetical protein